LRSLLLGWARHYFCVLTGRCRWPFSSPACSARFKNMALILVAEIPF